MRPYRLLGLLTIAFVLGPMAPVHAASERARLVVVAIESKGGPNIKSQVTGLVEKDFKKHAVVIPFSVYSRAAREHSLTSKDIMEPGSAKFAGAAAGATHVLFIEGVVDKVGKKKKTTYYASVTLVDVVTGDTLLSKRYLLKSKKLSSDVAKAILSDVTPKLVVAPPPAPVVEPPPAPPAAPTPPPVAAPPVAPPVAPDAAAAPAGGAPVAQDANAVPPVDTGAAPAADAAAPPAEEAVPPGEPAAPPAPGANRVRPSLRMTLGVGGFSRVAHVSASSTDTPPCYCEPSGSPDPVFALGSFNLELYPLSIGGDGSYIEGLGLHFDGWGSSVTTNSQGTQISSTVFSAFGGLQYRIVFADRLTAPDLQIRLGYGLMSFPLTNAVFPGISYKGPYLGVNFTAPLKDYLAILANGRLALPLQTGWDTAEFGSLSSSFGFRLEGGVRFTFDPIELSALGFFEQYNAKFTGNTRFPGTGQIEFTNVSLTDRYFGGLLQFGLSF